MAIPILAYHLVRDQVDLGIARTTLKQFRRQMEWLKDQGYRSLTLSELNAKEVTQSDEKAVVITFDDSYTCIENAASIMNDVGFSDVAFAVSEFVGRENAWDYQFGNRRFKHADHATLRSLLKVGWEVGSHTANHEYLPGLSDTHVIHELRRSKEQLEDELGSEISTISYPFGRTSATVIQRAKETGYKVGVTLGMKQNSSSELSLPRLGIYLFDTLKSFEAKLRCIEQNKHAYFAMQRFITAFSSGTVLLNKIRKKYGSS